MKTLNMNEYSEMFAKTKVKIKGYPVISAIGNLIISEAKVSNLAISRITGLTPVRVGQVTTEFEANGLLNDVSTHPLRKDWAFTELGQELFDFINSHFE